MNDIKVTFYSYNSYMPLYNFVVYYFSPLYIIIQVTLTDLIPLLDLVFFNQFLIIMYLAKDMLLLFTYTYLNYNEQYFV